MHPFSNAIIHFFSFSSSKEKSETAWINISVMSDFSVRHVAISTAKKLCATRVKQIMHAMCGVERENVTW